MRILSLSKEKDLKQLMRDIHVDTYGIKIMLPKAQGYLLKVNALNNISANILKQEMLSLGGDVAVARGALTGKVKKTDCLIMGSLAQLDRLSDKLRKQPFGLNTMGREIGQVLENYQRENLSLVLGGHKFNFGTRSYIMGIVNLTPDSFSGDGLYAGKDGKNYGLRTTDYGLICNYAEQLVKDGADIIDIGGESTRPGAKPVSLEEELSRVIPVIKAAAKKIKAPISVDTYKPEVARQALDNGASMVNDITALKNSKMSKAASHYKAGVAIMHMRGNPRLMQKNPRYVSLIDEIIEYLSAALTRGVEAGIAKEKIVIDPGIGFGKTPEHNFEILKRLKEFKVLGRPILVGVSRKAFIGKILNVGAEDRIFGSVASCVLAAKNGANIFRVHDVKAVKQALLIEDKIG
ncbi:MAG: dihydropteroate synthase [Candidatus Omnitrophota bacterium]|nr:dihydropteroate synthase [Candidatus Omnitrophota bacterium]